MVESFESLLHCDLLLSFLCLLAQSFLLTLDRVNALLLALVLILVVIFELHLTSVRLFDFPSDLFVLLTLTLAHLLNFVAILFLLDMRDRVSVLQE